MSDHVTGSVLEARIVPSGVDSPPNTAFGISQLAKTPSPRTCCPPLTHPSALRSRPPAVASSWS